MSPSLHSGTRPAQDAKSETMTAVAALLDRASALPAGERRLHAQLQAQA